MCSLSILPNCPSFHWKTSQHNFWLVISTYLNLEPEWSWVRGGRRMLQNWNAPAPTAKFTWKPVPLNSADFEISTAGRKKGQKEQRDRFLMFFTRIDPVADPGRMSADSLDMIGFKPLTNRIQSIYILKRTLSNFEHDRIWDVHRLSGFHKIQDDPPLCFFYITDNRCALFCIMDLPPHWGHAALSATSKHWPQAPNPLQLEQMTLELHMLHIMLHSWHIWCSSAEALAL